MARTVDAAPTSPHVRLVGRRLDRSAADARRVGLGTRTGALPDVGMFAVAASRLLHIAGAQSLTCNRRRRDREVVRDAA